MADDERRPPAIRGEVPNLLKASLTDRPANRGKETIFWIDIHCRHEDCGRVMSYQYNVDGAVTHGDGLPATDVTVVATDADAGLDDPLGAMPVRPDGSFTFRADSTEFGGSVEEAPEVHLFVFRDGAVVHEERTEPDPSATVEVTVERAESASMEAIAEAMCRMHHGMGQLRGIDNVPRDPFHPGQGRFGRMFPFLEAADHDVTFLQDLGRPGGFLDEDAADRSVGLAVLPAGNPFLGQFIDHDITLDPLSSLTEPADPDAVRNFRTPRLDLDSVYATGPEASPYLYESPTRGGDRHRLLTATDGRPDVPRNREGTALVGDHRNDENHIISQFQYAMLQFHNAIVDWLGEGCSEPFERANTIARWHYHWIVLDEFLPTVCDPDVVEDARENREFFTVGDGEEPYIPLEFAVAAYRYGHSQIRRRYQVNAETGGRLFGMGDDALGMGFQAPAADEAVDWRRFFPFRETDVEPQSARTIDPLVATDLLDLPFVDREDWRASLASRNLVRGRRFGLPSGQAVARAIGVDALSNEELGFDEALEQHDQPSDTEAPLWYYVLAEARDLAGGDHLGPVGSRIVAETLVGLLEADPSSYLTVQPNWRPTLPAPHSDRGEFTTADLLEFAVGGRNDA